MNIAVILFSIVILVVGVANARLDAGEDTDTSTTGQQTPEPTVVSTPEPPPVQTPAPAPAGETSGWVYPGAVIVSSGNPMELSSSEHTDKITDWYRDKIERAGYNIRNSIKTSANDVVKNVIQAVDSNGRVSVEITKNPGEPSAKIEVLVSPY